MNCKTYTYLLSSGQLDSKNKLQQAWIRKHLLICSGCRRFTRNHQILTSVLKHKKQQYLGQSVLPKNDK
ncbi:MULTISPECIES: hypothetical protein [Pelistega]|uniref:hypothetical protein n=1 Tax=Pelistega TaxID=106146 RepID=UPI00041BC3BC|nr:MULTISPECIES: hypothetical protein [Pelistega]